MPFEARSVTCQVMEGNLLVIDAFTPVAEVSGVPLLAWGFLGVWGTRRRGFWVQVLQRGLKASLILVADTVVLIISCARLIRPLFNVAFTLDGGAAYDGRDAHCNVIYCLR